MISYDRIARYFGEELRQRPVNRHELLAKLFCEHIGFTMRAIVVPSESLMAYERAGYLTKLVESSYFNPAHLFNEVLIASPFEPKGERHVGPLRVLGVAANQFSRLVKEYSPDLVRAYGSFGACDLAVYQSKGVPVFVSVHDTNPQLFHNSLQFADAVMCTSHAVRLEALRHGVQEERCHVLGNWVDREQFFPCPDDRRVSELKKAFPGIVPVLHVGRKSEQKNLDVLIEALPFLPEAVHVFFIGRGDVQKYLNKADNLGVSHRCHWVESVPNEDLRYWYSWCRCMCTPSLWEGFGIVFIEASACATPIVTSDISPMNEFLVNGVSAVLVKEYMSPASIAKAILSVINDDDFSRVIGNGALEMVMDRFERGIVQKKEAELMLQAIENYKIAKCSTSAFVLKKRIAKARNTCFYFLLNGYIAAKGIMKAILSFAYGKRS